MNRRSFLSALVAAPFIPKFSMPEAAPWIEIDPHDWRSSPDLITLSITYLSWSDPDGLVSETHYNPDGTIKSHWQRPDITLGKPFGFPASASDSPTSSTEPTKPV